MSTTIKPVISKKNEYWIERHRYYELKHFCLQYPIWVEAKRHLDSMAINPALLERVLISDISDPVERCREARESYDLKIQLIRRSAIQTDGSLSDYILKAVTENYSYEYLRTVLNIPCSRDVYYKLYRKFFWVLNKLRE